MQMLCEFKFCFLEISGTFFQIFLICSCLNLRIQSLWIWRVTVLRVFSVPDSVPSAYVACIIESSQQPRKLPNVLLLLILIIIIIIIYPLQKKRQA